MQLVEELVNVVNPVVHEVDDTVDSGHVRMSTILAFVQLTHLIVNRF
jgi:hypothetical protein